MTVRRWNLDGDPPTAHHQQGIPPGEFVHVVEEAPYRAEVRREVLLEAADRLCSDGSAGPKAVWAAAELRAWAQEGAVQ